MLSLASFAIELIWLILGLSGTQNFPPPLPPKTEAELFLKMKEGDAAARTKLIEHNLRLVAHIVRKYYFASKNQDDLISIGSIDTPGPVRKAESDTLLNELITAMMPAEARPDLMLGMTM